MSGSGERLRAMKGVCSICKPADGVDPPDEFMICCDACEHWFHGCCVGVDELEATDLEIYHCDRCVERHGPSVPMAIRNNHRYERNDPEGHGKLTQTGTKKFIDELKERKFPRFDSEVLVVRDGSEIDQSFFEKTFDRPILFTSSAHLGMSLPPATMSLEKLCSLCGMDRIVDVIDVYRQRTFRMKLSKFLHHFQQQRQSKTHVLNLISLEVSDAPIGKRIVEPALVRAISWVDNYWPREGKTADNSDLISMRPQVSKFCLMSMKDAYTDFHIDFSGTSVWYSPVRGRKLFYLIPPTPANLRTFENWMRSPFNNEQFFGDLVPRCVTMIVQPGNVVLIPTGWIHAVLTLDESLVFGGNFLHIYSINLQIDIFDMERQLNTHEKFIFPHFVLMHWYVAARFLDTVKARNKAGLRMDMFYINSLQALITRLKQWQTKSKTDKAFLVPQSCMPGNVPCSDVLRQLENALIKNSNFKEKTTSTVDPAVGQAATVSPGDGHLKLKIKLPVKGIAKRKEKYSAGDSVSGSKKKRTKAPEAGSSPLPSKEPMNPIKVLPFINTVPDAETKPLDLRHIFPASFEDDDNRPYVGYSLQQLKYYNASGPFLMAGSCQPDLQAKLEARGVPLVQKSMAPVPRMAAGAAALCARLPSAASVQPAVGKVRKAHAGAVQPTKGVGNLNASKARANSIGNARQKLTSRERLAQKLKIDPRKLR